MHKIMSNEISLLYLGLRIRMDFIQIWIRIRPSRKQHGSGFYLVLSNMIHFFFMGVNMIIY